MNEQVAWDVVLMSAIEHADNERRILTDEDRMYASRSANELAQWEVSDKKLAMSPELFLQKRAEQVLKKIAERHPGFAKFVVRRNWWRGIGLAVPILAFLSGFLADRIADPHRVDLLSAPLLLILFWNLAVYAALLIGVFVPALRKSPPAAKFFSRLATRRMTASRKLPQPLAVALGRFAEEWTRLSTPLTTARAKRIIHVGALCFALGAISSLYARGIFTQYRAGWESTFLSAEQVHVILTVLFTPVIWLLNLEGFSIADVRAFQFSQGASHEGGAKWVALYAATLFLLVVVPRLVLALAAGWKETKLARHFPVDLAQPYFRKLTGKIGPSAPAVLRVYPYSFTVDEARDRNLSVVAQMLIGEQARVMLRPSTSYGDAEDAPITAGQSSDVTLTAILFNMTATPEKENHGAFLDRLSRNAPRNLLALIDQSAYLERIGAGTGSDARMRERISLWRQFCELHNVPSIVINLLNPHASADEVERGLAFLARPQ